MCRSWVDETIKDAYHFLEMDKLDAVSEILIELNRYKTDEDNHFTYTVEGFPKCSIRKADYYFSVGSLLSAFPDRENEALEAFCLYNYYQLQKKEGVELDGSKTYYSFRKANEYSYADLANNTITLVSPKLMNDPIDTLMFPWLRAKKENTERLLREGEFTEEFKQITRNIDRLFTKAHDYYKIRSFCAWEKGDKIPPYQNPLMWSHYADSHTGFCVVYKLSPKIRFKQENSSYYLLKKMEYRHEALDLTKEQSISGETALLTKSDAWEYEHEFRLLMYDPSMKKNHHSLQLDEESCVYAIIFGMKCSDGTKSIVRSILKDKPVKYYQIEEDLTDIYSLKCNELWIGKCS